VTTAHDNLQRLSGAEPPIGRISGEENQQSRVSPAIEPQFGLQHKQQTTNDKSEITNDKSAIPVVNRYLLLVI